VRVCVMYECCARVCHVWVLCACVSCMSVVRVCVMYECCARVCHVWVLCACVSCMGVVRVCVMYESCARVCHVWVLCACVSHLLASEHSSSEPMRNRTNYRHVIGPTKKAEDSADSVEGLKCWGMWNILKKAHVRLKETEKRDPFTV